MSDNATLRQKARSLLRSGQLPARPPDCVWGGQASGSERCLVCGDVIAADQVVWEAEFVSASGASRHFFHVFCYRVLESPWRGEKVRLEKQSALRVRSA